MKINENGNQMVIEFEPGEESKKIIKITKTILSSLEEAFKDENLDGITIVIRIENDNTLTINPN